MRRGLACFLLLVAVGASVALPQYGPSETQPSEALSAVLEGVSGGVNVETIAEIPCGEYHGCVPIFQCTADGVINTSGAGLIDLRVQNGTEKINPLTTCYHPDHHDLPGVCCRVPGAPPPLPPVPVPIITCPEGQVCTDSCTVEAPLNNGGTYTDCYADSTHSVVGVCCNLPPLPPVPTPLITCPAPEECVEQQLCGPDGKIITDGTGVINIRVYSKTCVLDDSGYTPVTGVCCLPPAPPPPEPVVACKLGQVCTDTCAIPGAGNAGGTYEPCYLDGSYAGGTGVCCEPPIPFIDTCPGEAVCVPGELCLGKVLDTQNAYVPYSQSGTWSQCDLGSGYDARGVCCINPVPEPVVEYLPAEKCGVRNYGLDVRIQNKNLKQYEAQFGEFPWQAIIFFKNFTFKCGASLIEDRWLLTAAHCVHGYTANDFQVRLGEWQVNTYDEPLKYVDAQIASITIHPDFVPGPVFNDVALIELTAPVTPQYHVNTVCLPQHQQVFPSGTRCIATGWGKDAFYDGNYQVIMKKVDLPIVEKGYCQELLRKTKLGKWFNLNQSFMCAGGEELQDACEGDGGGPLVCEDPISRQYFVAGITAWGIGCGTKDVPGVYVDVQLFTPWIEGIIYSNPPPGGYGR